MKDTFKNPCPECPFRKNSAPGWLGPHTATELHQYVMAEGHFACHMTIPANETNVTVLSEVTTRCQGSVLYMGKNCKSPQDKILAEQLNITKSDPEYRNRLENILNLCEFHEHHSKKIA